MSYSDPLHEATAKAMSELSDAIACEAVEKHLLSCELHPIEKEERPDPFIYPPKAGNQPRPA